MKVKLTGAEDTHPGEEPSHAQDDFVNLPVADVEKSVALYEAVGFTRDERFSRPGTAAAMTWSDTIVFMILSREHFADFTSKTIIDARSSVEALLCLSLDRRSRRYRSSPIPHRRSAGRPIPASGGRSACCCSH
jgi:hypothetical protein